MFDRTKTRKIKIGDITIGGGSKIAIQSMCNTKTEDVESTVRQIQKLECAGCDIVRCAVPNIEAAKALEKIKSRINIPLVADIHFDYRLAIAAIEHGADKIRINPGNIGTQDRVQAVVRLASKKDIPIRIGINSGSLEKEILEKYNRVTAEALYESAVKNVALLEALEYENLVVSIKASDTAYCIKAYELFAEEYDYPLHLGVTEAGGVFAGSIKSAVGIGIMLNSGIGDTFRVSLTADPAEEIRTAKLILQALKLKNDEIELISCPTCGRTQIDLIGLAKKAEALCRNYKLGIKVAVMGCAVNGPGEAKEADLAVAGGKGIGLIIKKGKIIKRVKEDELLKALKNELDLIAKNICKESD